MSKKKEMIDDSMAEFIKAVNGFTYEPIVEKNYKVYYEPVTGKIFDVTVEDREGEFVEVEPEYGKCISVLPTEFRVKDGEVVRLTGNDIHMNQFTKSLYGKYKTIKDDMLFLDNDGEDSYE